jgi:DNA-binding NarL/FixJ family response regulator
MITVVIADDHHLVREGLRALLERAEDIKVIGEAQDGQEAVELVEQLHPDVLVLDISMPRLNGIQAAERLRGATRIVFLSMHSDETLVQQALHNGARGYLLKRSVTAELLLAIRAAQRGELYLSPEVASTVLNGFVNNSTQTTPLDRLSPREREVLQLIAEGRTNNEIAEVMTLSVKTVEKHRASIMSKLDIHDLAGMIRMAIKYGLVFIDE